MIAKLPDWEQRLQKLVLRNVNTPFERGVFDCAFFAADALLAVSGADLRPQLSKMYGTDYEARKLLFALSEDGMLEKVASMLAPLGIATVDPYQAQRGALAFIHHEDPKAKQLDARLSFGLGVFFNGAVLTPKPAGRGFNFLSRSEVRQAWQVPTYV